jgi:hypothetical protein
MAIVYAVKTGNWSDTTVWNTGALPTSADDVYPNTFTVTINQNITVKSLDNRATTGVTAGGSFTMGGSFNIVADTINSGGTANFLLYTTPAGSNATCVITANTIQSFQTALNTINISLITNFNLTINANIIGTNSATNIQTLHIGSTLLNCIVVINGNLTAQVSPAVVITNGTTTCDIYGLCTSSTNSAAFTTTQNSSSLNVTITKAISVNNGVAAVSSTGSLSNVTVKEIEQGNFGQVPISGYIRLSSASGAFYKGITPAGAVRTLSDPADIAGQVPAQTDVRFGVSYQSGSKTGSAYIPAAASVGFGVPVDNTTGTASLTPTDVWTAATSALTTPGSIGERLKNASTVDTTGNQLVALL